MFGLCLCLLHTVSLVTGRGIHLQKQGALAGHTAGEPTEALARLWWCVRTTASTEQAGQGCEPGHAGVQAKASQDKVNWQRPSGGFMVCFFTGECSHIKLRRTTCSETQWHSLMPFFAVVFHLVCPPRRRPPQSGLWMGIQMLMRGCESRTGHGLNRHGKRVCTKTRMQTSAYEAKLGSDSSMGKSSSSSERQERSESERAGTFIED